MHFQPNHIYHVYNRGNHQQPIFYKKENYLFFLSKIRKEWLPFCDILCYCLMPNHFHFMLSPNEKGCEQIFLGGLETHMQELSKAVGKTLSSYTKAINIQNNTTGNLFQKKTQAKCLNTNPGITDVCTVLDYLLTCFTYIHNNPLKAGLINNLHEWDYSSWPDYFGFRNGTLCNKKLTKQMLGLTDADFSLNKIYPIKENIVDLLF